jgi:DNA anti-recombination protein RmuC
MDPTSLSTASFEEIRELLVGDGLRQIEAQLGERDRERQAEIAALRARLDERFRLFALDVETRIARLEAHLGETREAGAASKREAEAATTSLRDQISQELARIRAEAKEALRSMQEQVVGRGDLSSALERIARALRPDRPTPGSTASPSPDPETADPTSPEPPQSPWQPDEDPTL